MGFLKKAQFMKKLRAKDSRLRFLLGSAFKWKRLNFDMSFLDALIFKVVSVFEAVALVSALCFFYLCCGCRF